ncbi:MAG: GYDIA family GHMP kinase [Flavobacteriales bacterium]|jgi:mevalonate kinase|tara:strand:- start:1207 stop:2106 length:900 start_codon:yes stop_codon:yes gene_type:complete
MDFNISSPGKLLITAEYYVVKGALALAIPTKFRQSLDFKYNASNTLKWKSFDKKNDVWLNCEFQLSDFKIIKNKNIHSKTLQSILISASKLNPDFLNESAGGTVSTHLDFCRKWGLGTSSTLIYNISKWAKINPYELLWANFKGSGYDIACASAKGPLLYKLENNIPIVKSVEYNPKYSENIFFVYLNTKQDSNIEIDKFFKRKITNSTINKLSDLTVKFVNSKTLLDFQNCIKEHENIISKTLEVKSVKNKYFKDYSGEIKSLGAWGGDFILAAGPTNSRNYFYNKGYKTVFNYKEMF